jgi:hypothetical protein
MKRFVAVLCLVLSACSSVPVLPGDQSSSVPAGSLEASVFGKGVEFVKTPSTIADGLGSDFNVAEIANLGDIEKAYGITLTAAQRRALSTEKFVMLPLTDTNIDPYFGKGPVAEWNREFLGLYGAVVGNDDYKERTQANAVFLSSDIFFHSYNLLYTELLKEMENESFFPSMKELSATFFDAANAKVSADPSKADEWRAVRNYFAVPHALLSTAKEPLAADDYSSGAAEAAAAFAEGDKTADSVDTATAFVKNLKLDAASEAKVIKDLQTVFAASGKGVPEVFKDEYAAYYEDTGIDFGVDFSQFTPRSHYTGSSLRRQYFRAMNWYSQLAFFVKSPALTAYAFDATQLMAEHPEQLEAYAKLESTINFLVGTSDDLMPTDYMAALEAAKGAPDTEAAVADYLAKARQPRIKSMPAGYDTVGEEDSDDVLQLTKGMRFFSGKFIIDSYWTGRLTQGDEAPRPGYTQKLPPMASSLEVMALLGSDYAKEKIPTLDFYKPETREAIDQAMKELADENATLDDAYWTDNVYNGWLWTIRSLFDWQEANVAKLPRFMQGDLWAAKTLMTGAGFWTELRHATLLYAKQSFAELGGGPPGCDPREIPAPAKGYIEPQIEAYDRLAYLAARTKAGLEELGFGELRNMRPLSNYVDTLDTVRSYVAKELGNAQLQEKTSSAEETDDYGKTCTVHSIEGDSDWETIRLGIVGGLEASLPEPIEGPVLPVKDKRAAILADVHTGGDSANPTRILYEGTGVPSVMIVAVKDQNGPRATIGFAYTQYEFTKEYGGQRMTDEEWQKNFYANDDTYTFEYRDDATWPAIPSWFAPLFAK